MYQIKLGWFRNGTVTELILECNGGCFIMGTHVILTNNYILQ